MKQKNPQKGWYTPIKTKQGEGVLNNIQDQELETTANTAPHHHIN